MRLFSVSDDGGDKGGNCRDHRGADSLHEAVEEGGWARAGVIERHDIRFSIYSTGGVHWRLNVLLLSPNNRNGTGRKLHRVGLGMSSLLYLVFFFFCIKFMKSHATGHQTDSFDWSKEKKITWVFGWLRNFLHDFLGLPDSLFPAKFAIYIILSEINVLNTCVAFLIYQYSSLSNL